MSLRRIQIGLLVAVLQIWLPVFAFAGAAATAPLGASCVFHRGDDGGATRDTPAAPHGDGCSLCIACCASASCLVADPPLLPSPRRGYVLVQPAAASGLPHGAGRLEARARAPPSLS
jgi:hypothetical protein